MLKAAPWYSSTLDMNQLSVQVFTTRAFPSCVFGEVDYMVNSEHIKPLGHSYFKTMVQKEVSLNV